ncbi:MAG: hypothetical protein ABIK65_07305 [Candidatus Eisenbacteria bacterium]
MSCFSGSRGRSAHALLLLGGLIALLSGPVSARVAYAEEEGGGADTTALSAEGAIGVVDTVIEAAGGRVRVNIERTSADLVRMGESMVIEADQLVKGDAVVIGGNMDVYGQVNGDAVVIGGTLDVYGQVSGDAVVIGGTLHLYPTAVVQGDAVSFGGVVVEDEGAEVNGEKFSFGIGAFPSFSRIIGTEDPGKNCGFWCTSVGKAAAMLVFLAGTLFLILISVELFTTPTERVATQVQEDYLRAGLAGLLVFILTLPALLVLGISIVGLLLYPFLFLLMIVAPLWGFVVVSLVLGRTWAAKILPSLRDRWVRALIGAVLLFLPIVLGSVLIGMGPFKFFGWSLLIAAMVIHFLVFLVGIGAVFMTRFGRRGDDGTTAADADLPPTLPVDPAAAH